VHIIIVTIGSSGDVHPFLGLGMALAGRGHRVTLATNPYFEQLVRLGGMEFVPLDTEKNFREMIADPMVWHRYLGVKTVMERGVLRQIRPVYDAIAERYEPGETVVVGSSLAFGARVAQEHLGIPLATVHLAPSVFLSTYKSPVLPGLFMPDWLPRPLKQFQFWSTEALVLDRMIGGPLNALRRELGLAPARRIMSRWWHSPDRVIAMFPEWYAAPQPDWPPQTTLAGFPLYDEQGLTEPPSEVAEFLAEGDPPIVFTPGSANVFGHRFFAEAAEACRLLGRRGMLLTRFSEQIPRELPSGVRHFDFVPFRTLLPKVAALVHHGGIGTLSQGLAAGVPQLIMPMSFDQPDNAARIARLGVGTSLSPRRFRGPAVARRLAELLGSADVEERCREVAGRFVGVDALGNACDVIETLAEDRTHLALDG